VEAVIGAVLAVIVGSFYKLKGQVEAAQTELREKEFATARAQAMALQAQINPHFFFNTLNSISALIDRDPKAAQRMIGLLAGMFRYTFGSSALQSVPLEEELGFVRDYLSIEQARFSSRLQVDLPSQTPAGIRVPGLVLQPLVENAVRHGISQLLDGGTVGVYMGSEGGEVRIAVRNTADQSSMPDPASIFKAGHALENVRNRLRLFTGQSDPIRVATGADWVEFSFLAGAAK
jgi:LytS/YehU family sensor histidine kinase